ncbi:hypothetical protein MKZ38_008127 [Zalerion maritima]|uniref:Uncharacterized protein n=1 Tax=Zalerion maritima TaxID=339359 RepID=A0AAD5WPC0_9PEZI|nr:hypothetical protein MKZ38_008127 [Zalerion maritima]
MFRDESSHVIKKAKAKQRRKNAGELVTVGGTTPGTPATPMLSPPELSSAVSPGPLTPGAPTPSAASTPTQFSTIVTTRDRSVSVSTPGPDFLSSNMPTPKQLPTILTPKSHSGSHIWTRPTDEPLLPSPDSEEYPRTPSIALGYSLSPSFQEQGTAFFFSKFVSAEENSCNHQFDYVFEVWKPGSLLNKRQVDGVMASMTAVGLAGLSQVTNSGEMLDCARKSYGTALRLTNMALEKPSEAVKDTTMLSVLILGIFEMVVRSQKPLVAWHKHINGAAALAKMRGLDQFKTRGGIKMFIMLNYSVVISCLAKATPMPQALMELRKHMPRSQAEDDGNWAALDKSRAAEVGQGVRESESIPPISKLLQTRHDLVAGILNDPAERVRRLLEIEQEYQQWLAGFPDAWRYQLVRIKRSNPAVLGGICHTYTSPQHVTIWSCMRSCRMLVLEMLRSELIKGFESAPPVFTTPEYLQLYHRTDILLRRLGDAIIKSTPFNLCKINVQPNSADVVSIPTVVSVQEPASRVSSPRSSVSGASSHGGSLPTSPYEEMKSPRIPPSQHHSGPTLLDPAATSSLSPEESEMRFHMLASANNVMLVPLYYAGMSSVCTPEIKQYVVERLDAIWKETGIEQAQTAAAVVEEHDLSMHRKVRLPTAKLRSMSADILREQKAICAKLLM